MIRVFLSMVFIFVVITTAVTSIAAPQSTVKQLAQFESNATSFGFELGVATFDEIKSKLGVRTTLKEGKNLFGDPMLSGDGKGLDMDGILNVDFMFDSNKILESVILRVLTVKYQDTYDSLSRKYKKVSENRQTGEVVFTKGDSIIQFGPSYIGVQVQYKTTKFAKELKAANDKREAEMNSKRDSQL